LEVTLRRHKIRHSPIAIIGLGKLGGRELSYGSDLDILFVAEAKAKDLPKLQKLAIEIMDLLSRATEAGKLFETDARLRPDGEKGLLVNTLAAYEEYYERRAWLWEIQALTRARFIGGNETIGRRFEEMAASLTNFARVPPRAASYRPDWKAEIARMRQRVEKERTPPGKDHLAIKTGTGGLMDAEFLAQALSLEHGWHEPNTLGALNRARDESRIPRRDADELIESYCKLRIVESILRRWSFEGEAELPSDPAPLYRVAVRCGYPGAESFLAETTAARTKIRGIFTQMLPCP
ncbi:MAG TPA: hypothetical protein VHH73_03475, partial [Verrucomicrobiae bacterium]|nr:hypothetical protein [Verrucomicrobiae bacterium]